MIFGFSIIVLEGQSCRDSNYVIFSYVHINKSLVPLVREEL